jgi:hypothetical protein
MGEGDANLARSIAQFAHLLLVTHELSVKFLDLDLDSCRTGIRLSRRAGRSMDHEPPNAYIYLQGNQPHLIDDVLQCRLRLLAAGRCSEYPVHECFLNLNIASLWRSRRKRVVRS